MGIRLDTLRVFNGLSPRANKIMAWCGPKVNLVWLTRPTG